MNEWTVYSKDGLTERCKVRKIEYGGEFMGACSLTVSITSPTPIHFELGDYIEYRGERFEMNYDPSVLKQSSADTDGEGFTYDGVVFNSLSDELTRCDFLDYVASDNELHYTSLPTFSFFADSICKLAERIRVNLDRIYTGERKWTVIVHHENVNTLNVNISVSNNTVWDALGFVNSKFGANFIIRNRTITIGTTGIAVGKVFSYGKGNGLYKIERNAESGQKIITRLRAYGSTRNLPTDYYRNVEGGNVPNNMAVKNLMLPDFPKITHDPYIDSDNVAELGVREGTVFFDGSGDLEEIYPTMEGMTAEDLADAGIIVNATGELDVVKSAEQITDNGVFEPAEGETEVTIPDFTITLKDIGFDINDYLSTSTATISMQDGMCGGREFEIVKCEKSGNDYVLTCHRSYDDGLMLYFPYSDYQIKSGDKYVLLNIEMPDVYIQAAAQRLLAAAKAYLAKNDYVRYSYTLSVDNIFMARQHDEAIQSDTVSIHDTIKEGDLMLFEDADLGVSGSIIISSLKITEDADKSIIPEYDITLKNEQTVGTIEKIQNQISSILSGSTGSGSGLSTEQVKSLILAYGAEIFLSKTKDDRSKGKISSDKAIEVGNFVTGASGAIIQVDASTGQTVAELDKLYVRMKAYFETLEIINVNSVGGKQILSPVGSVKCIGVEETDDAYRCYFLGEQDGEVIENRFEEGDQAYSQMFNANEGVSNKVSNKYYWRLVTGVSSELVEYENHKCHYIDLSKTDCDTGSDVPEVGDVINQRGSRYDADRMNFIEFSSVGTNAPYITLFQGVNSYSLDGKDYVSFGYDQSTAKAYMNVYGDMYVGDREGASFLKYTQEGGLELKGKLSVGTTLKKEDGSEGTLEELIAASSPEGYEEFVKQVTETLDGLQNQIDGAIETWFYKGVPTLDNVPASGWDTEELKNMHLGDLYYDQDTGKAYRFQMSGDEYVWQVITDTDIQAALEAANKAKDTADGKRRVFVGTDTPSVPYDEGDLWSRGSEYPLLVCINPKSEDESFEVSDWDYADDSAKTKEEILNGYLYKALTESPSTEIENGLVLSSLIQLRDADSNIMSGINGLVHDSKGNKSIATWWGGDMYDLIDYYTWSGTEWVAKSDVSIPSNIPNGLIRFDGTGYFAGGKFWWDENGEIHADPTALLLSFDTEVGDETLAATIVNIRFEMAAFSEMWKRKWDANNNPYLYTELPIVTQQGITMYSDATTLDVESIYEGLPIDGTTIYWEYDANGKKSVLKAKYTDSGDGTADFSNVLESGEGNAFTSFTLSDDKKVLTFVKGESFAKKSDFDTLNSKVTDFLEGSDTDTIINKWIELEAFLSGLSESDDLATILGTKANKATTLAGYGITDAYSKDDVDSKIGNFVTIDGKETITGAKNFTGGISVNGSPIVYNAENGYWMLTGDLLVTGAMTMYANEGTYTPSTIMDAITTDGVNLKVVNGVLTFVGETGGGVADAVAWENITGKPSFATVATSGKYSDLSGVPTLLSSFTNDAGFITSYTDTKNTAGSTNTSSKIYLIGATTQATNPQTYSHDTAYVGTDGCLYSGGVKVLTAHQSIYKLTFQSGTFSAGSFTANSGAVTINVPTTTTHISEGSNLYFTNARAQAAITGGASTIVTSNLTASRALISNSSGKVAVSDVTSTELGYLDGVTSSVQTQLDAKLPLSGGTMTGTIKSQIIQPKTTDTYTLGASSYLWSNLYTKKATIDGISIYKSTTGVLYIDGDLVVSGGVTMYGTDSVSTSTIMNGVVVDGTTIMNDGTKLYLNPDIQLGGGSGSVTSVGLTAPTGFSVSGSPVTSSGTLALTFASGYSLPTTTKQTNWDTAYGWGNHASAGYLKTHQTLYTLTLQKNATQIGTFTPTANSTINITMTKSDVGLSNVENTALSTWAGSTNITKVGTVASGTWNGSAIGVAYGGTGNTTLTSGCALIGNGTSAVSLRSITNNTTATEVTASTNLITANTLYYHKGNSNIVTVGTITSGTWNGAKIANAYLANSSISISGTSVSLGGSITQAALRTALGLGSNAYTSTAYLPLTGGEMSNTTVVTNLNADLLDGYNVTRFPLLNAVCGSTYDLNDADRAGYYNVSMSTNRPSDAYGYGMMETIEVHTGLGDTEKRTLQVYYPHYATSGYNYYGMAVRMRNGASNATNDVWGDWRYFVTKDGNVATATNLKTSRSIWGQSFDGSGDIKGHLYLVGASSTSSTGNTSQILFGTTSSHHLALSSNSNRFIVNPTSSTTTGQAVIGVNGQDSYFTSSGDFGIGTSSPTYKLHVVGTAYVSDALTTGSTTTSGGNILPSATSSYTLGSSSYKWATLYADAANAGGYVFNNGFSKSISSAGWYRFATSTTANNAGGTYIFFIRRNYYNTNNESYIVSCTVDYGGVHWTQLNGHSASQLITNIRCTYTNNSTMYFDFYYSGTVVNIIYVNAVGNCTLQTPASTTSTLTTTVNFNLANGYKSAVATVYAMTLYRNATSGGCFIRYGANSQLTYSWAAGVNASHQFSWYYKDTSAGTDTQKMYLTSAGTLSSDYWVLNNVVTNPYLKLTHTYNSTTYTHYLQGYQGYLYLGAGSSKSLRIDSSGNGLFVGGVTMYSDIRKKIKLRDVVLTLEQIADAPLIEHYYNSDEKKTTHVGSIAQYWAGLNDWFCKKDDDGFYTMEIQNAALASAISVARELSRYESETDRRIRLLEQENVELRKEIEKLKTS